MNAAATPGVLLEVRDLHTHFFTPEGVVRAVDGVDLTLRRGRTLCVLGESGCGKSITARSVMQLVDRPGRIVGGRILFHDVQEGVVDVAGLATRGAAIRRYRGKKIALVFQEPMTALSPVHTIGSQIVETIRMHNDITARAAHARAVAMLGKVGIPNPAERMRAYAFQLSGGMRQRAVIALALCCEPDLLIADEPTTALDVTTQATILDLMRGLQAELGMAMMFITHDLGVVAEIADDVAVMYLGEVVEQGRVEDIFARPRHPYTQALMASVPRLGSRKGHGRLASIRGMVPHPFARPEGCTFHTALRPALFDGVLAHRTEAARRGADQQARCHLYDPALAHAARAVPATIAPPAKLPAAPLASDILLRVEGLKMHFPIRRGFLRRTVGQVRAVDGVSFGIRAGRDG